MAVNAVVHKQTGTTRTKRGCASPAIWADCPVLELLEFPDRGYYFYDNFLGYPLIGTQTTQIGHGQYKVFNTGAGVVQGVSAVNSVEQGYGGIAINLDTDNDSGGIMQSYPAAMLTGLPSTSGKLWFEAELAVNTLLTDTVGIFIGLAETDAFTMATAVPFNAGSETITAGGSLIGFKKGEDALGVVDTVRSDRAVAWTNIGDDEGLITAAHTFAHFGMIYDPAEATRCVRFFQDNVELSTALTRAALIAFTNLDANPLGMFLGAIADSAGTTAVVTLRGWRLAQLAPALV